jgi:hypothetical protein
LQIRAQRATNCLLAVEYADASSVFSSLLCLRACSGRCNNCTRTCQRVPIETGSPRSRRLSRRRGRAHCSAVAQRALSTHDGIVGSRALRGRLSSLAHCQTRAVCERFRCDSRHCDARCRALHSALWYAPLTANAVGACAVDRRDARQRTFFGCKCEYCCSKDRRCSPSCRSPRTAGCSSSLSSRSSRARTAWRCVSRARRSATRPPMSFCRCYRLRPTRCRAARRVALCSSARSAVGATRIEQYHAAMCAGDDSGRAALVAQLDKLASDTDRTNMFADCASFGAFVAGTALWSSRNGRRRTPVARQFCLLCGTGRRRLQAAGDARRAAGSRAMHARGRDVYNRLDSSNQRHSAQ